MDKFDCVVIGAGMGGLGAAAELAIKGIKPLVLERQDSPGGSTSSFVRGRFEFETSLHLWIEAQMAPAVRGMLGLKEPVYDITKGNAWVYKDGDGAVKLYEFPNAYPGIKDKLKEYFPQYAKNIDDLIDISAEMVGALVPMDGMSPEEIAEKFPHLEEFGKLTVQQAFEKLGTPQELRDLYMVPWYFEGTTPEETNFARWGAVFFILFTQPTQYPKNRTYGVLSELETIIRKNGGDVWYNTAVTKIDVENGQVKGVETDKGDKIETDIVVSNAAPKTVYGELIGDKSQVKDYTIQLQNSMIDNVSYFNVYMGLDIPVEQLGLESWQIFAVDEREVDRAIEGSYSIDGPYTYDVLSYNTAMPDWSPEGTCIVNICIPMRGTSFEGLSQKEYMQTKDRIAQKAVDKIEELLGVDLKSHIEEVEIATPVSLARYNGHRYGALGYKQTPTNTAQVRSLLYDDEHYIKRLYLVGQFESPYGIDNVINGAEMGAKIAESVKGGN